MSAAPRDGGHGGAGRWSGPPRASDGWWIAAAALAVRAAFVAWAAGSFPPVQDGAFYHVVASRIAEGNGYTWLWPDGVVTFAAHYPVGYPALLGAVYVWAGAEASAAMVLNAIVGSVAALAAHRVASVSASRSGAILAGSLVAFHPGLVAYSAALMTEGVVAAALAVAVWMAERARAAAKRKVGPWILLALALGVATLIRPQSVLLAPALGFLAASGGGTRRSVAALLVLAGTIAVCLPWTVRNCARMGRCTFVSANGGWNLLIGAGHGATGTWVPIERIEESKRCATVFDEAEKDVCFARAGARAVAHEPTRWLALVPAKLSATFDRAGAPAWYLHDSNPDRLGERGRDALAAAELVLNRVTLAIALLGMALVRGPRRRLRIVLGGLGVVLVATPWAWPAYLLLVAAGAALGGALVGGPLAVSSALVVVALTALTHAAFFGAARYALPCVPALSVLAGTLLTRALGAGDTSRRGGPGDAADRDRRSRSPTCAGDSQRSLSI